MYEVSVEEAGAKLPQILEDVKRGIEVIIKQNNIAIAKLSSTSSADRPKENKPRPQFGSAKGLIHMEDDFDKRLEDFADYM